MAKTRVILADHLTLFREALRSLLNSQGDFEVVAEMLDAGQAATKALEIRPDLVLLDIGMPGPSSFEAARRIRRNCPEIRVAFLTMYDDEDYLVESLETGSAGYILKDSTVAHFFGCGKGNRERW